MAEIRFDLVTYENGRRTVRTTRLDVTPGALLVGLDVRADGDLILAMPFGVSEGLGGEDEGEEQAAADGQRSEDHPGHADPFPYEPGELAQPGTYGGEVFDRG